MGAMVNERVSAPTSNVAKKIMESMGWKDGDGLGAKGDGRKSHIATVKNGPDGVGYGKKERHRSRDELWWANVYEKNDGKKKKKKKKKHKSKKKRKQDSLEDQSAPGDLSAKKQKLDEAELGKLDGGNSNDDDDDIDTKLFKACGGARLGMRARGEQAGKFKRTEEADSLFLAKYGLSPTKLKGNNGVSCADSNGASQGAVEVAEKVKKRKKSASDKKKKKKKKKKEKKKK